MSYKLLVIIFLFLIKTIEASDNIGDSAGAHFKNGMNEYKNKNYTEAQSQFNQALDENPRNVAVLLNLGLTYYQLNQKGKALVYLLKGNALDPDFEPINQAIEVIRGQLKTNSLAQKNSYFEVFRNSILNKISLNIILALGAISLLFSGYLWIRYFSQKKKSFEQELDSPDFPAVGMIIFFLFILSAGLGLSKIIEAYSPRAIILSDNTQVKMAPGEEQSELFVLQEGSEVLVGQLQNEWVQVTYPGSLTGWVSKEKIILIR